MAYFRCGGGGMPAGLQSGMDSVLNKKFGTSTTYPASGWPDTVNLMGVLPEKTVSGAIAVIDDGADDVPTKSLIVTIPPTLSGISSVTETQTGRNLFDISTATGGQINGTNGVYYENANWQASDFFPVHGANLTLSWDTDSSNYYQVNIAFYDSAEHYIDGSNNTYANIYSKTFTIPSGAVYCRASWSISVGGSPAPRNNIRINLGSADSGYTPYTTPTTYTASLGRTIYGGQVDIVNGEGQATWGSVDLGDLSWTYNASYLAFYATVSDKKNGATGYIDIYEQTNYWITSQEWADANNVFYCSGNNKYLAIKNTDYSDASTFKTAMTGHKFVYEVATPTDFTFTGQEVPTRLGYNAFWSDEGDTEVTYRRDIDLALGGN